MLLDRKVKQGAKNGPCKKMVQNMFFGGTMLIWLSFTPGRKLKNIAPSHAVCWDHDQSDRPCWASISSTSSLLHRNCNKTHTRLQSDSQCTTTWLCKLSGLQGKTPSHLPISQQTPAGEGPLCCVRAQKRFLDDHPLSVPSLARDPSQPPSFRGSLATKHLPLTKAALVSQGFSINAPACQQTPHGGTCNEALCHLT